MTGLRLGCPTVPVGLVPNVITYNSVTSDCEQYWIAVRVSDHQCWAVAHAMRSGCVGDWFSACVCPTARCLVAPNVITYNAMIRGCEYDWIAAGVSDRTLFGRRPLSSPTTT